MESYFDDRLLETFADTFYGYGDYHAPYWFIGAKALITTGLQA